MASWLQEMSLRGMGLHMCEFLDFVQEVVKKESRKVPFKDGRPGKRVLWVGTHILSLTEVRHHWRLRGQW